MKKAILLFSALFVSTLLWSQTAVQPTGSGTEEDPYLIATLENLYWVSTYVNSGGSTLDVYFKQTANIDASPTADWFGGEGWVPIGLSHNHRFSGHYNGNGKVINGLTINRPHANHQALFGVFGIPLQAGRGGATIKNLGIHNANITGGNAVGGIAGGVWAPGTTDRKQYYVIKNCFVSGEIKGESAVGGVVGGGRDGYEILHCYNLARVMAVFMGAGGIAGNAERGFINYSYSVGQVSGQWGTGGLVGQTASEAEGEVTLINSYWDLQASGQEESAGGTGVDTETMKDPAFWIGTGWDFKGAGPEGIWNKGNERNNGYPYLNWQHPDDPPHAVTQQPYLPVVTTQQVTDLTTRSVRLKGSVLLKGNPVAHQHGFCWNTSGNPSIDDHMWEAGPVEQFGSFSHVLDDLQPGESYYVRAFVISEKGSNYGEELFFYTEPLEAEKPDGDGTTKNPYLIARLNHLYWIALESAGGEFFWDNHFIQTADIDASATANWFGGQGWLPIGDETTRFNGYYDGQGYRIDGLSINRPQRNNVGLFGQARGQYSGIALTNMNIVGLRNVGAIVGALSWGGALERSFSKGQIEGRDNVGALVGFASEALVLECYSNASVSSNGQRAGGLVGSMYISRIKNSYFSGEVSGTVDVGGLVGQLSASDIRHSYSVGQISGQGSIGGLVGTVRGSAHARESFWDVGASGQTESALGKGISTSDMQSVQTYLQAGWDFMGAETEGTWNMGNERNNGYPYLAWQHPDDPPHPLLTESHLPYVAALSVMDLRAREATVNGRITTQGLPAATRHGFCWNTTGRPELSDPHVDLGAIDGFDRFAATLTGLEPNTFYYVRAFAENTHGISYGNQLVFRTSGPQLLPVGSSLQFEGVAAGSHSPLKQYTLYIGDATEDIHLVSSNDQFALSLSEQGPFDEVLTIAVADLKQHDKEEALYSEGPVRLFSLEEGGKQVGRPSFLPDEYKAGDLHSVRGLRMDASAAEMRGLPVGSTIELPLFDKAVTTATVLRVDEHLPGSVSLAARLDAHEMAYFTMSTTGERSLGSVRIPETGRFYQIISDPFSLQHYLLEMDEMARDILPCGCLSMPDPESISPLHQGVDENNVQNRMNVDASLSASKDIPAQVDLMIVYTPAARDWANTQGGGIENVISEGMMQSLLALQNSQVDMQWQLVHADLIHYHETGHSRTDLGRLAQPADGYMDEIHEWRDFFGADLVALLTLTGDVGGVAGLLENRLGTPSGAFSLTRVQQASDLTLAHELGHNMGLAHHKQQFYQPGPGIFSYSAGWTWTDKDQNRYSSIMAYGSGYADGLFYPRAPYFSNPLVTHHGVPTGDAQDGDNARTLEETKHVVAGYREPGPTVLNQVPVWVRYSPQTTEPVYALIKHSTEDAENRYVTLIGNCTDDLSGSLYSNTSTIRFVQEVAVGSLGETAYRLTGNGLSGPVVIEAPDGFKISLEQETGFAAHLELSPSDGNIHQDIYVQFYPSGPFYYQDLLRHYSPGVPQLAVAVEGRGVFVPPSLFTLFGGGTYYIGEQPTGVHIHLSGSQLHTTYHLLREGERVGPAVSGTGEALVWEDVEAGVYTVLASNPHHERMMDGEVEVREIPHPHTITASAGQGGAIEPAGEVKVEHGADQVFNINPDTGHRLLSLLVDEVEINLETDSNWNSADGQYAFTEVIQNHSIAASFAINQYTIDVSVNNEQYGSVSGGGEYEHGAMATLVATSQDAVHYIFVNWTENGTQVHDATEYVFEVTSSRSLVAHFQNVTAVGPIADLPQIRVYPVPASDRLVITGEETILQLRLLDLLGRVHIAEPVDGKEHILNVTHLESGLYILHVIGESGPVSIMVSIARDR